MNTNKISFMIMFCGLIASCTTNTPSAKINNSPIQDNAPDKLDTTELSIDPVKVSPDKYKVVLENEFVRVVEYSIKPGERDNTHTHPPKTSYVVSGGTFRVYPENEKPFDYEEVQGASEWSGKRGKHYTENIGKTTITILLTEIKSQDLR